MSIFSPFFHGAQPLVTLPPFWSLSKFFSSHALSPSFSECHLLYSSIMDSNWKPLRAYSLLNMCGFFFSFVFFARSSGWAVYNCGHMVLLWLIKVLHFQVAGQLCKWAEIFLSNFPGPIRTWREVEVRLTPRGWHRRSLLVSSHWTPGRSSGLAFPFRLVCEMHSGLGQVVTEVM